MKKILILLSLYIVIFIGGCATSKGIKHDSKGIWHETKDISKKAWHETKIVSKTAWNDSKKAVHDATEE